MINDDNKYFRLLSFAAASNFSKDEFFQSRKAQNIIIHDLNTLPNSNDSRIIRILPLCYQNTKLLNINHLIEPDVTAFLKKKTIAAITRAMENKRWLLTALDRFKKKGIPVILLKGAAFNETLYPKHAPRLGLDIDLLVTSDSFNAVCSILSETMSTVLLDSRRKATHEGMFERVFTPQGTSGPTVEIHRGLTNPFIFNIIEKNLWNNSIQHPDFNSELVRILSPEDTLLHLSVHGFRDLDFCNHNLLDAHEIWTQWKPDHNKLILNAKEWGAQKVLYYLLEKCNEIMKTTIPEVLVKSIMPKQSIDKINKKILQSQMEQGTRKYSAKHRMLQLLSQLTFPDRMRQGIRYQLNYAHTRIKDIYDSR